MMEATEWRACRRRKGTAGQQANKASIVVENLKIMRNTIVTIPVTIDLGNPKNIITA
jgi:hypothetical protein